MDASEVLRVLDALAGAGISTGITGGWGVDALLRRQSRLHGDIDLGIASGAVDAAIEALEALGYALVIDQRPARLVLQSEIGQVDLHPIVWGSSGTGVQRGSDGASFDYPAGSLEAEGEIAGRVVHCGTPTLQVAFHTGYEPGVKDRLDMAALASAFGLTLGPPYGDGRAAD